MFYKNRSNFGSSLPSRLIFVSAEVATEFQTQDKKSEVLVQVDQAKREYADKLTATVDKLQKAGNSPDQIKKEIKKNIDYHATEILQTAVKNLKLIDKQNGRPVSFEDLELDPKTKSTVDNYLQKVKKDLDSIIDSAVDNYFKKIQAATEKAKTSLEQLANPPAGPDLQKENPELAQLNKLIDEREQVKTKSAQERSGLNVEIYRKKITSEIDLKTDPNRPDAIIDDYQDSINPFSKENNTNNRTRRTLDGYLYGVYLFNGGQETGKTAVDQEMGKAEKLYSEKWGNRLDYKDILYGMRLEPYLKTVDSFSQFDRVKGLMAALLLENENFTSDPVQKNKYEKYLLDQFAKLQALDTKSDEDAQLNFLFKIKSPQEALGINVDWRVDDKRINGLTDSGRQGALIEDYEGTDNENNPVRQQLEGYLFGIYLWNGQGNEGYLAAEKEYGDAGRIYEQSGTWVTKRFDQKHLNENLGLGLYLDRAKTYSKFPKVQGAVAELLQLIDHSDSKNKTVLEEYFTRQFALLNKPGQTEDEQLNLLATLQKPELAETSEVNEKTAVFLDLLKKACQKHPQLSFSVGDFAKSFEKLKDSKQKLTDQEVEEMYQQAAIEIQKFISSNVDTVRKDLNGKMEILKDSKKISADRIERFQKRVDGIEQKLSHADSVASENLLQNIVQKDYLDTLLDAQREYYVIVKDFARETQPQTPEKKTAPKPSPSAPEALPAGIDIYAQNWKKGHDGETSLGDFQGLLQLNSGSASEQVLMRGNNGKVIEKLSNDTFVTRTIEDKNAKPWQVEDLTFVMVTTHQGKHGWIAEDYLFPPETSAPAKAVESPELIARRNYFNTVFEKLSRDVETKPEGGVSSIDVDGFPLNYRIQKMPDGYHLMWQRFDTGTGNFTYKNIDDIKEDMINGVTEKNVVTWQMQFPQVWAIPGIESQVGKASNIRRTGTYAIDLNLNWPSGTPNVHLEIANGGIINYRVDHPNIGPNGENFRSGQVRGLNELAETLGSIRK